MKKLMTLALLAMMVLSMVSAGGSKETQAAASDGPVTVKVWVSSGSEDDKYKEVLDRIEAETGIVITDEYYPKDELDQKLQVSPLVGDTPELIIADYLMIPSYYSSGLIQSLDEYMPEDLYADFIPSVKGETSYDGQIVSVAQFDAGMALWANKSMLENAGVRIPESWEDAWTKEEFEDALEKLQESGVPYPLYIRQNKPASLYFQYMPFLASFGGSYLDEDKMLTAGALDSEGTVAAFEYLQWMVDQDYINGACDYENGFYERKESALALLGHWKYADHVNFLGDDAILVPCPDLGGGVFSCSGSTVWAMTTAAADNGKAEAAWTILEKALEPENILTVTDFNGAIPSRVSVMDQVENLQEGGRLYLYRKQLEDGISVLRPLTPAHMTIYNAMQSVYSDVIGGADPYTALHNASQEIDEVIVDNGWNS